LKKVNNLRSEQLDKVTLDREHLLDIIESQQNELMRFLKVCRTHNDDLNLHNNITRLVRMRRLFQNFQEEEEERFQREANAEE